MTQELLSLVTGLAHYLKLLIRIGLQGALKLEREKSAPEGLYFFLDNLGDMETLTHPETPANLMAGVEGLADPLSDCCAFCKEPVDDECVNIEGLRWHIKPPHLTCAACQKEWTTEFRDALWNEKEKRPFCYSCAFHQNLAPDAKGGFIHVTKLKQYVFLLQVALARLLAVLRAGGTLPHTSGTFVFL